jgi:hypothetical protein
MASVNMGLAMAKVGPVLPIDGPLFDELRAGFVHERRPVQGIAAPFA